MIHRKMRGFTVIELLVVIVIIAILALITAASYNNTRIQAEDTRLVDGVNKIADSIQLWISKNGRFPRGGSGATVGIGGNTECPNGSNGYFGGAAYNCTLEDTLVASGYLPAGFSNNVQTNSNGRIMVYDYGSGKAVVYYDTQEVSAADTTHFNAQLTKCGIDPAGTVYPRDSAGMKNGVCILY